MSSYITTHDPETGASTFSSQISSPLNQITIPSGTVSWLYAQHTPKPSLNNGSDNDITQFAYDRVHGLPNGAIAPAQGFSASILTLDGEMVSPMHRTLTLDVLLLIEGVVELWLDSGEMRTISVGDSVVQRGTMHQWKNVTPNKAAAKFAVFAVSIAQPFEVAGKTLESTLTI